MKESYAIVLAAGSGRRMGGNVPKQYRILCGKPVLYYSLKAFEESSVAGIVLVVAEDMQSYVQEEIIEKYHIKKIKAVIVGGKERQDSVKAGVMCLPKDSCVLVHDGARPFVSAELIERMIENAQKKKACIPAVAVKDTIKLVHNGEIAATPNRAELYAAQTPQAFWTELLQEAFYKLEICEPTLQVTDDAMLVEEVLGQRVAIVDGEYRNIKLTTEEDFVIAQAFLQQNAN
ncbi:MAG: 2-C-methyl-D-erythritol 4-phosphate cytidylyltransferase [Lachnospiraceae bacterium]|nr:2-C-methyl-D-erythritol 4-phosphate cytidylyltransferase [Lachnospiraceae bacterium]